MIETSVATVEHLEVAGRRADLQLRSVDDPIEPAVVDRAPAGEAQAAALLETRGVAFMPIEALAPEIAVMLALRTKLGVRNSTHTIVKMLQPFAGAALRIVSVTHPDYLTRMRDYFTTMDTAALLLRGAEGEAVAHPRREPAIEWLFDGRTEVWKAETAGRDAPELPVGRDPSITARWIEEVLAGEAPVPHAIEHQVECCRRALAAMQNASDRQP